MAKLTRTSISRRTVENLSVEKDTVYWDRELPGFGVRAYATGSKVYVVQTRAKGQSKRVTIGRHGVIAPEEARRRAALIISRIKSGQPAVANPAPKGPTVSEVAGRYVAEHVEVRLKASTARMVRIDIDRYILPEFGKLAIEAVGHERIAAYHSNLHRVPSMANRMVETLSAMFSMAETWGLLAQGGNPCPRVVRYKARRKERFLTEAEFERLGRVLSEMEAEGDILPRAAAAIRLLMLTGCRCNEILKLRWDEVDLERNELPAQGFQDRSENGAAVAVGGQRAGGAAESVGRSLGDSRTHQGKAVDKRRQVLEESPRAGETRGRSAARSSPFVRLPRTGAGGEPADDRQAPGTQANSDHGAVRAPGGGLGEGIGRPDRREHRGGDHAGRRPTVAPGAVAKRLNRRAPLARPGRYRLSFRTAQEKLSTTAQPARAGRPSKADLEALEQVRCRSPSTPEGSAGTGGIEAGPRIGYPHERAFGPQRRCPWTCWRRLQVSGAARAVSCRFPDRCNGLIRLHLMIPVGRERFCPATRVDSAPARPSDTRAEPGKPHLRPCLHRALVTLGAAAFKRARPAA